MSLDSLLKIYEGKLESVFTCNIKNTGSKPENVSYTATERTAPSIKVAKPRVLIPVFPGTNCEYDSAKAVANAGAEPIITVINNLSADGIARSIESFAKELKNSQIVFIPGGFSGGDEPDGSGKFITAFFRNPEIKEGVTELLEHRDGLMCGILCRTEKSLTRTRIARLLHSTQLQDISQESFAQESLQTSHRGYPK